MTCHFPIFWLWFVVDSHGGRMFLNEKVTSTIHILPDWTTFNRIHNRTEYLSTFIYLKRVLRCFCDQIWHNITFNLATIKAKKKIQNHHSNRTDYIHKHDFTRIRWIVSVSLSIWEFNQIEGSISFAEFKWMCSSIANGLIMVILWKMISSLIPSQLINRFVWVKIQKFHHDKKMLLFSTSTFDEGNFTSAFWRTVWALSQSIDQLEKYLFHSREKSCLNANRQ